ncbi:helix-turn-helix domain-containing protein [Salinimonas sediminis]|uniref:XRE family transcriptional regulator n=1 Tax=Salinimonas sediminis TaxID=2303538 RepID=A0A346NMC0_9ALTE|nr:helix-turn-helix transcriptional regulator [Salinimonas sediminis]AXR06677.1 XRE family transcriptional regulator [Salinimonas sediminis]
MAKHTYTKDFSIAVMNHAIAAAKREGQTQEDIAKYLHVGVSNVSKYKNGESKLKPDYIDQLIKRYGGPRAEKGEYQVARIVDNVDSYIEGFSSSVEQSYAALLDTIYCSPGAKKQFADMMTEIKVFDAGVFDTDEVKSDIFRDYAESRWTDEADKATDAILDWLTTAIRTQDFKEWMESCLSKVDSGQLSFRHSYWPLPTIKHPELQGRIPERRHLDIMLLGYYLNYANPKFNFSEACTKKPDHKGLHEVVLKGETILNITITSDTIKTDESSLVYIPKVQQLFMRIYKHENRPSTTLYHEPVEDQKSVLSGFELRSVQIRLHLNSDMNYRLCVNEDWGTHVTTSVIKNVKHDSVFGDCKRLSEFFGLNPGYEKDLKQAIAERGGFIPGAIVL